MTPHSKLGNSPMRKLQFVILGLLWSPVLLSCSEEASLFNESFVNLVSGGQVPIAPGPNAGYVEVLAINSSNQSIEWVVTSESEEIIVNLDRAGGILGFDPPRILEPETVELLTDVDAPTLAIVFTTSPVEFPPVGPGELTFEHIQDAVNQLAAKDPESVLDRDFIRLVRVLRIGLGPRLNVPSGEDEGIIIRPPGSDPNDPFGGAGAIFPSEVNNALSYNVGNDPADFGNGDILVFLATTSSNAIGGISVTVGVLTWESANGSNTSFDRDTFEILRGVEGPISPLPPN